jgi:ABC-type glutathione transport system ATPase component
MKLESGRWQLTGKREESGAFFDGKYFEPLNVYRGPRVDKSGPRELWMEQMAPLLIAHALGGAEQLPQVVPPRDISVDHAQVFIFAPAPDGFRLRGDDFHQSGWVLYQQDIFKDGDGTIIDIRHLSHSYKTHRAVCGASFAVARRSIHGFVGPNGAGKTTTLKILATLIKPQAGTVTIFGRDIIRDQREVRRRIGFMPDHFSMYRQMTVFEYPRFLRRRLRLNPAATRQNHRRRARAH